MNYKQLITICILTLLTIFFFYLEWIMWIISLFISLLFYWTILYFLYYLFKIIWSKIRKNNKSLKFYNKKQYLEFLEIFFYRASTSVFLLFTILWSFWYYQNIYSPAKMPVYTISNWEKTVIFQAMSHIWTENFYDNVRNNIKIAKENWYILFFEWVRPGRVENVEKFNNALWVEMDQDLYKNMAKLYWLTNQDNSSLLNIVDNKDYNIDLSIDDIVELYEKNNSIDSNSGSTIKSKRPAIDANKLIIESLANLNERQLQILRFINKSIINMIIKNETIQNTVVNNFWNKKLFEVILWNRNEVISNAIIESENNKIIITYWLLHFNWVFDLLKNNDSNWKIEKTDYLYPIKD